MEYLCLSDKFINHLSLISFKGSLIRWENSKGSNIL